MEKDEIKQEIENLEFLLDFHSQGYIKDPKAYENHINSILDRLAELKKRIK